MDQTSDIKVTVNKPIDLIDTDIVIQHTGGLTGVFTAHGNTIFEWCADVGVDADLLGSWYDGGRYLSAWRVSDPSHRLLFVLQWSTQNG